MDQQWQQPYSDTVGNRQNRYSHSNTHQQSRETNSSTTQQQQQPSLSSFSYEAYQTPSIPSHPQSMAASPIGTPRARAYSGDGDVAMEDADPYNRMKYPSRPNHQQRASGQHLSQEDSAAARRYSPMKALSPSTLSPSSHYVASPHQSVQTSYGAFTSQNTSARQSPTRSNPYSSPTQNYYSTPCEYRSP